VYIYQSLSFGERVTVCTMLSLNKRDDCETSLPVLRFNDDVGLLDCFVTYEPVSEWGKQTGRKIATAQ